MKARRRLRRALSFRPRLEALEPRTLLSVCTVDRLTDVGEGSGLAGDLRYCLTQAQDGDSITFEVTGTINLTRALPDLTRSVSIEGPGADLMTVRRDTGGNYRIFTVAASANVSITGLTITNGNPNDRGGGIFNSGTLTLTGSIVSGNTAAAHINDGGGGISNSGTLMVSNSTISGNAVIGGCCGGGGIFNNNGTITLSNSTISDNSGDLGGGGVYNNGFLTIISSTLSGNTASNPGANGGGAIFNNGQISISNSTISGNSAVGGDFGGGAVAVQFGMVTLNNSTVAGNSTTTQGGAIFLRSTGRMSARNTIIAGNTAPSEPDVHADIGSQGHNLIGNTQGGSGFRDTDLLNVDPMLGPLQDNGGPTQTMTLLPGSPAIDAGDNAGAPDWDQRGEGFPRIVGIVDPANPVIDIGAFEVQDGGRSPRGWHGPPTRPEGSVPSGLEFSILLHGDLFSWSQLPRRGAEHTDPGTATGGPLTRPPALGPAEAGMDQLFAMAREENGPGFSQGQPDSWADLDAALAEWTSF